MNRPVMQQVVVLVRCDDIYTSLVSIVHASLI
jgi:hypothetical protein